MMPTISIYSTAWIQVSLQIGFWPFPGFQQAGNAA